MNQETKKTVKNKGKNSNNLKNNEKVKKVNSTKKTIKIKKSESNKKCPGWLKVILIIVLVIVGLVLVYKISPREYLVSTPSFNIKNEQDIAIVKKTMGEENMEENFRIYFQWYITLHEIGHGLLMYNSQAKLTSIGDTTDMNVFSAHQEHLVNEFAYAYWSYYGESDKLEKLGQIIKYAAENIEGPNTDLSFMEYAEKNYDKEHFMTYNEYGWFQFNSGVEVIKNNKSLKEVLKEMGIENFELPPAKTLKYELTDDEVSIKILNDAKENINSWGLKFPNVVHVFDDDPFKSYGIPRVKLLGLIGIPDYETVVKYMLLSSNS